MSRYDNTKRNQYNSTPRKVFDAYIDRMATKRARDKEDHRNDMQTIVQQLKALQNQLTLLEEHVAQHCHVIGGDDNPADPAFTRASDMRDP